MPKKHEHKMPSAVATSKDAGVTRWGAPIADKSDRPFDHARAHQDVPVVQQLAPGDRDPGAAVQREIRASSRSVS